MRTEVLKALIENSTLLVVAFLLVTRFSRWNMMEGRLKSYFIQGFAYTVCGILAIMFSVQVLPGVLIDMRTPIIAVAALTGGPLVGLITIVPLLIYRLLIGGTGLFAGIGIIVTAYVFGLILRHFERKPAGIVFQLLSGIGCAVVYYIWILTLPGGIAITVLKETFVPLTAGSVLAVLAIFLIRRRETAHQDALNRLQEVSDLFEEISLDENIGITVLDGTEIAYINTSLLNKFGFKVFDPANSDLLKIVAPENRQRINDYLKKILEGETPLAVPMDITLPGRGTLSFLVHARKLLYRNRNCILVVSVDLTRLVETEKALQKRIDQLQLALEASGAVMWKADLARDLLEANQDFFLLLHYLPDRSPPLFSGFIQEAEMSPEMEPAFRELQQGNRRSIFGEISFTGSDGRKRWFNTGARITGEDGSGTPAEITGILFETTAIKEKELYLMEKEIETLQSQKMETIGRLAGGVAHDFNNLLHVIMGYTEILKKISEGDPVTAELSKPILDASTKGRELVRQLLLFSRKKTPELKVLDLSELTGNFLKLLQRIIEENIVISVDIPAELPPVMGDPGQIEQVLMNLCINSRDAMPDGGKMEIVLREYHSTETAKLTGGILKPGRYVALSVRDSGPGIPPEKHSMIFEPFYTTKQVDKGTGLGLSTVLGIMDSHGGAIQAGNLPRGGFEVRLYFPATTVRTKQESEPVQDKQGKPADLKSVTVLVAEDDPQVRNLTTEGLGAAGIKVLKAADGREAVETYLSRSGEIDILVFDVVMPVLNGPEAYMEIASAGYDVPVIFTTGYAGDSLSALPGRHRMLSKPYVLSSLVRIIAEELGTAEGENR